MVRILSLSALFLAALLIAPATLQAEDHKDHGDRAEEIYRKCVKQLRHLVTTCRRANARTVEECLPRIKRLLKDGKYHEAREVAARCIHKIEQQRDRCNEALRQVCRVCVKRLLDLGAEELARKLHRQCHHAKRAVNHSAERAIAAIRKPFHD